MNQSERSSPIPRDGSTDSNRTTSYKSRWLRTASGRWTKVFARKSIRNSASSDNPLFQDPDTNSEYASNKHEVSSSRSLQDNDGKEVNLFWPCPKGHPLMLHNFPDDYYCDHCFGLNSKYTFACPECNYFICLNRCYASFYIFPKWILRIKEECDIQSTPIIVQEKWLDWLVQVAAQCKWRQGIAVWIPVSIGRLLSDGLTFSMLHDEELFKFLMSSVFKQGPLTVKRQGSGIEIESSHEMKNYLSESFAVCCALGEHVVSSDVREIFRRLYQDGRIDAFVNNAWGFKVACCNGHLDTIKMLMDRCDNRTFNIPWRGIAAEDQLEVFEFFFDGSSTDVRYGINLEELFIYSTLSGGTKLTNYLLNKNVVNRVALHIGLRTAVISGRLEPVRRILAQDNVSVLEALPPFIDWVSHNPDFDKLLELLLQKEPALATDELLRRVINTENVVAVQHVLTAFGTLEETPAISSFSENEACEIGSLPIVKLLVSYGAFGAEDTAPISTSRRAMWLTLAIQSNLAFVKYLVEEHMQQRIEGVLIYNAYVEALRRGHHDIADYLVSLALPGALEQLPLGTQVEIVAICSPGHESQALQVLGYWEQAFPSEMSLSEYFDALEPSPEAFASLILLHAAESNCPLVIRRFLGLPGLAVTQQCLFDALEVAVEAGNLECVRAIQQAPPGVDLAPITLKSILLLSAGNGSTELLRYFLAELDKCEAPAVRNSTPSQALHEAAVAGRLGAAKVLLAHEGTDPMAYNCAALRNAALQAMYSECSDPNALRDGALSRALQAAGPPRREIILGKQLTSAEENFRSLYEQFPWLTCVRLSEDPRVNPHAAVCRHLVASPALPFAALAFEGALVTVQHFLLGKHRESWWVGAKAMLDEADELGITIPSDLVQTVIVEMCSCWTFPLNKSGIGNDDFDNRGGYYSD